MKASTANTHINETTAGGGHGEKLSRRAEAAIAGLLSYPTISEAAQSAGISKTTLWRWLQRDDFRHRLKAAQGTIFENALDTLKGSITDAVNCLRRNLTCKSASVQVQAARSLVEYALKTHELLDVRARVSDLEARLAAREKAENDLKSLEQSRSEAQQ
jgi:hypothetical protein